MEHKTLKYIFVLLLLVFYNCEYFENDGIEYKIQVYSKIFLTKNENDESVNLIYWYKNDSGFGIINNCSEVYFDSLNRVIYVKYDINNFYCGFYEIKILNNKRDYNRFEKKIISKNSFYSHISQINKQKLKKWIFTKNNKKDFYPFR